MSPAEAKRALGKRVRFELAPQGFPRWNRDGCDPPTGVWGCGVVEEVNVEISGDGMILLVRADESVPVGPGGFMWYFSGSALTNLEFVDPPTPRARIVDRGTHYALEIL